MGLTKKKEENRFHCQKNIENRCSNQLLCSIRRLNNELVKHRWNLYWSNLGPCNYLPQWAKTYNDDNAAGRNI